MNLNNIEEGTIILAPSYLHATIRETLLKHKKGIINVQLSTLSLYLGNDDKDESTYAYYQTLKQMKGLSYHQSSVASLSFITELKTLITHMKQYQIPFDRLPEDSAVKRELKQIISELYPIKLPVDTILANLATKINEAKRLIICNGYCEPFEHHILKLLENNGAKHINMQKELKQKEFYYALNKRSEIESVAQYIIFHKLNAENIKISLFDNSYLPYLKMIFKHYGIPLQIHRDKELTFIHNKFIALLQYYLKPCNETSIHLLNAQIINTAYLKETIDYLSLYEFDLHDDFHVANAINESDTIDERELKRLQRLETKAKEVQIQILPIIKKMEALEDIIDVLCYIDSYIIASHPFTNQSERKAILQIREEIKKCDHYLNDKDDLAFFMDIIAQMKIENENICKGCAVSDLTHPLPDYPYHFVLGGTQQNFPALATFNSVFDESYYDEIGYPNLRERYELHMQYCLDNLNSSETLICSYPVSSFDGKANESSLELEQFMGIEAKKYPLKENYIPYQRSYMISSETAKRLFIKDNTLYGSISSFEKYAGCPYAYFLRYGLKLKESIDYNFNNAKSGILNHSILEILTKQYGKDYVYAKKSEIHEILNHKIKDMIALYPNQTFQLQQLEKRLFVSIMKNLEVLKDHEEHSFLNPTLSEYHFKHEIAITDSPYHLQLNGFIDRIDMNDDFFRIIDYKSSAKSLKEEEVFAALQLQLITYLCVMEEKLKRRPLGAFYYSFANPNINMSYAKRTKRPLGFTIHDEKESFTQLLKEKKLSGWITDEYIEVMDDNGAHIKGVRINKDQRINTSTIYDSSVLNVYIHAIYDILANAILAGNIDCKSAIGVCTYCPYGAICANANHSLNKAERIEVDAKVYIKGGKRNA